MSGFNTYILSYIFNVETKKLNFIFFDTIFTFVSLIILVLLVCLSVKATKRFSDLGRGDIIKYHLWTWGFIFVFFFFACSINDKTMFYVFSVMGYIGAFISIWRAFRAANAMYQVHSQKMVDEYNAQSHTSESHYIKCPACGHDNPLGILICMECQHDMTINITDKE